MAEPDRRARDSDRDAAIELVEAALRAGRIVQVDRDMRVGQLEGAQTVGEIQSVTRDLQPAPPVEPSEPTVERAPPEPVFTAGPVSPPESDPSTWSTPPRTLTPPPRRGRSRIGLVVLVAFIVVSAPVIALIGNAVNGVVDTIRDVGGGDGLFPDSTTEKVGPPDVLSKGGYADLVAAIEDETGSDKAFRMVLYPEYATVDVPVERTGTRMESYYWDGALNKSSIKGTADQRRFSMSGIDPAVVVKLVNRARRTLVEDANASYAIIAAPGLFDESSWIFAYASNEYGEGGYLAATRDGKVARPVTW